MGRMLLLQKRNGKILVKVKRKTIENGVVSLDTKLTPSQDRARATFELVLDVAAKLLTDVGFERLSTNMICKHAGLTPPALYRYFPNKYAVLMELANRLMERQDEVVFEWIAAGGTDADDLEGVVQRYKSVQDRVNQITREQPGGGWIMRAIRAIPMLRDVRLKSRDLVAGRLFDSMRKRLVDTSDADLEIATRLSVELMYAATEMVIEEPDRDVDRITHDVCVMVAMYLQRLH